MLQSLDTYPSSMHWHHSIEQQAKNIFYYDEAWLDLLKRFYGYSTITLITADKHDYITGMLPLCLVQSPLTGKRLVSLPFSDHCPLLAADEVYAHDLLEQALALSRRQKVRSLELRCGLNPVLTQCSELLEKDLYVSWLLQLGADPQSVWSRLHKPVQRQIKKAQKLDVQIRSAQSREDIARYHQLHVRTRMKHGMPAQPLRFFLELWEVFAHKGALRMLLAEHKNTTIAGMIFFTAGTTIRYAYGASDERYLNLAPNNLLLWSAISWGCEQGYCLMDLGRTARANTGLMEFKRRWGADEEALPYYYYPQCAGLAATAESSWKYRLLTGCWKRLPLSLATALGGHLYKYLG
ncbi:GNAT family N-acetyltransferase [Ktedonosporobacter rubrisoli]|uniref:GNAT family N-acetyltransferase n=1 Tax=Ktedonosporobacter rubrisoli TaxID=2509675 RepID=A0A4P6K6L5_KTERU|nr:GNAT family N-acetyltransferase [Ktedonosporobacter rubrisoli]QBD83256.1 GNAT family N-acetyltransferase [Ktedonosporobacter rubrisoli]